MTDPILEDLNRLKQDRRPWEPLWQDVDLLIRMKAEFVKGGPSKLLDPTGVWANKQLAAALHSFLINPAVKWFGLRLTDRALNENPEVQSWLIDVREAMLGVFGASDGNFHPNANELLADLGSYGIGCFFVLDGPRFVTRPLSECYFDTDANGNIDTLFRVFRFTYRQALQFYGKLPPAVASKMSKAPNERFTFIQVIRPREGATTPGGPPERKPYESIHIFEEGAVRIQESGFDERPFAAPRWDRLPGDTYAMSPGIVSIPDARMLQEIWRVLIRAAQKELDPPLMAPDSGFIKPVKSMPGAINYYRAGSKDRIEPFPTGQMRLDIGIQLIQMRQESIRRNFFIDTLQLREADRMTATEIMARRDERFRTMSPSIVRLQTEFLAPLIQRTLAIMDRNGMLPPPPEAVAGQSYDVVFVSPAALAQKTSQADDLVRWFQMILPVFQADPSALQAFDAEEYVRLTRDIFGLPPELLRTPEEVDAAKQQMAQQQAVDQTLQTIGAAGDAAQSAAAGVQSLRGVIEDVQQQAAQ